MLCYHHFFWNEMWSECHDSLEQLKQDLLFKKHAGARRRNETVQDSHQAPHRFDFSKNVCPQRRSQTDAIRV